MATPAENMDRLDAYKGEIASHFGKAEVPARIDYVLANLALEELKLATQRAEEPTELAFTRVADRFNEAAHTSKSPFLAYRSQLLRAWIRPIVWSDIVNINPLSDGEAKRVAANIKLGEAADEASFIANNALKDFDKAQPNSQISRDLSGFLNETTAVLLPSRHTTAKQYAVPTTQYDDEINPTASLHTDAIYYDNRRARARSNVPFQVEVATGSHAHIHRSIPIVDARTLGNLAKSSRWPHDDRKFMTYVI